MAAAFWQDARVPSAGVRTPFTDQKISMAQYVFTMNRLGKIVPPKRHILKDISLSFFPGAKIGVLGLNGSGKSTLLKIMAGVDKEIEGEAIPMPGIQIGYLPQEPQLNPEQTVRQAVEEGIGGALKAKARLEEVYAAYAEPDADFDALAAEPWLAFACGRYEGIDERVLDERPAERREHLLARPENRPGGIEHDQAGQGQAKPGPGPFANGPADRGLLAEKGLEDLSLPVMWDAFAGIDHGNGQLRAGRGLGHPCLYIDPALTGELDGIAEQVEHHLAQPCAVNHHLFRHGIVHQQHQGQTAAARACLHQGYAVAQQLAQVTGFGLQLQAPRIDPRHVQHVTQQAQQGPAAVGNQVSLVQLLLWQRCRQQQFGQADNAVGARAQVLAQGLQHGRLAHGRGVLRKRCRQGARRCPRTASRPRIGQAQRGTTQQGQDQGQDQGRG